MKCVLRIVSLSIEHNELIILLPNAGLCTVANFPIFVIVFIEVKL